MDMLNSLGKSFFSTKVMPQVVKTSQFVRGQLGQPEDKTELPADYIALEKQVDALKLVHHKLLQITSNFAHESYDYPSNLRESFNELGQTVAEKMAVLSAASSASEAAAVMTAPKSGKHEPKTFAHAIARTALLSSQALLRSVKAAKSVNTTSSTTDVNFELNTDDHNERNLIESSSQAALAIALSKYAIAMEKVGEARLAQDSTIQARFLAGLSTTLNTSICFAQRARKAVEKSRLHLDVVKAKVYGGPFSLRHEDHDAASNDERLSEQDRLTIEAAEDEFVGQTEEAVGVMKDVLDTPEPLRNLVELITAQWEFHKTAYEILTELKPIVCQMQEDQEHRYRQNRENA